MTSIGATLADRLRFRIRDTGPITVADYMDAALLDPSGGYYTTRDPFGASGDFVTAPEVSQMFGELIGVWLASAWQGLGAPGKIHLVELGPGRGTLMADILRSASIVPGFAAAVDVCLIERSPELRRLQSERLAGLTDRLNWHESVGDLPDGPLLVVANEFFDALPIRQFQFQGTSWLERRIGLSDDGDFRFGLAVGGPDPAWTAGLPAPRTGDILEISPRSVELAADIAERIVRADGAALLIDYGPMRRGYGDTFQAMKRHAHVSPLDDPGTADLTAHVDFQLLQTVAKARGALTRGPVTQGAFLLAMGLLERAGQLGSGKPVDAQEAIRDAVERLAAPAQMGDLFKILGLTSKGLEPPGFAAQ